MIYLGPNNPNGQATMASSTPVVLSSNHSPVSIIDNDATGTGTITAADAVVAAPAGTGALLSGASTAGSIVSLACPGGDSAWITQVTGTFGGTTVYFEGSIDSTNGADGNWINLNGRQTGVVNTVLSGNTTTAGFYRGNTSGLSYLRARAVGGAAISLTIKMKISAGSGAIFLNASTPAGTNVIGKIGIDQTIDGTTNAVRILAETTKVIGTVNVSQKQTYRASTVIPLVVAVTANVPFFNIIGSATKTIIVKRITFSGMTQTAVGYFTINAEKLSTASTLGTSTTLVAIALDSNSASVTAVVKAYTAGGTKGTLVGTLRSWRTLWQASVAAAAGTTASYDFNFGDVNGSGGVVLRGVAQELALTFPVVLATAGTLSIDIEWTEE